VRWPVPLFVDEHKAPVRVSLEQASELALGVVQFGISATQAIEDGCRVDTEHDWTGELAFGVVHGHQQRQMLGKRDIRASNKLASIPHERTLVGNAGQALAAARI
jgi:hypothetical protein